MIPPGISLDSIRASLGDRRLFPASCLAVFVGGSMARGWHHARSDADLYVITAEPWCGDSNGSTPVSVTPDTVPTNVIYIDERRWELRYWLDSQVDQVLDRVSWHAFQSDDSAGQRISDVEVALLGRLESSLVVVGEQWIQQRRGKLADSAFQSLFTLRALAEAGACAEDAQGMLESGDRHAAVLAAQMALGAAADAVSLSQGEFSLEEKWRARRLQAAASPVLPFERYWELITMQSFDPRHPETWVRSVVDVCRQVALAIDV
ncbi:hypothetical protein ACH4OY_29905 [Micromonospora rubida]|uniref:Polymerase nucleotidyl transferase domain-containing protein n=1 Tax=Micromonospora rubida TaxID=2697657 RepID=A0ABW7SVN3_9ACTN